MENIRKNYQSIDMLKFFCAFLVVGIHTEPFGSIKILDMGFGMLTRIAVPFFLIASSFFYFLKETSKTRLLNFIKRIFFLYLLWSLLYFMLDLPTYLQNNILDVQIKNFLIQFFISGYKHLWFLQALIVSMFLCSLLIKVIKSQKLLFLVALMLLIFGLENSTYYNLFSSNNYFSIINKSSILQIIGTRNGFFYAPIYIIMGRYFALNKERRYKFKNSLIGLCSSFALLLIESAFCVLILKTSSTILWISVVPLMYYIFRLALTTELNDNPKYISLRKVSVLIYVLHPAFIQLLGTVVTSNLLLFISVSIITLLVSIIIYFLSIKPRFQLMKWLY